MIKLLRHLIILLINMALASSFQFAYAQKNAESEWVKHVIASQINQDHGLSLNMGDYNGDGRIDVSIAWGQRNGSLPTDGIWWYECPSNPSTE
jgi:flagellar basal body-associated protein FliL